MAQLADPMLTKRERSRDQLIRMGLVRDAAGRRLVPLTTEEVARRLKERKEKNANTR